MPSTISAAVAAVVMLVGVGVMMMMTMMMVVVVAAVAAAVAAASVAVAVTESSPPMKSSAICQILQITIMGPRMDRLLILIAIGPSRRHLRLLLLLRIRLR